MLFMVTSTARDLGLRVRSIGNLALMAEGSMTECSHPHSWTIPEVSILILNFGDDRFLRECLRSICSTCIHVEIIVVHNGPNEDWFELVRLEFPFVRFLPTGRNLGFGRAYNLASGVARGRILVFLNNDTQPTKGWLEPLIAPFELDESVGLSCAQLVFSGTSVVNNLGGGLKLWSGPFELGMGEPVRANKGAGVVESFFACGAAMAIPKSLFDGLGGFDQNLSLYGEDVDLSWRARLIGYKVACSTGAIVFHQLGGSSGLLSPLKLRLVTAHHLLTMIKCLGWARLWHALIGYSLFALAKGAVLALSQKDIRYLLAVGASYFDAARVLPYSIRVRRHVQTTRTAGDNRVLKSAGYGLISSPRDLLKTKREFEALERARV